MVSRGSKHSWLSAAGVLKADLNCQLANYRKIVFMCAASCQGGHSEAGMAAAEVLGVPFPIRMEDLAAKATAEGLDPDHLWPWWRRMTEARK